MAAWSTGTDALNIVKANIYASGCESVAADDFRKRNFMSAAIRPGDNWIKKKSYKLAINTAKCLVVVGSFPANFPY